MSLVTFRQQTDGLQMQPGSGAQTSLMPIFQHDILQPYQEGHVLDGALGTDPDS